mmetsp:Transcript_16794/g.47798  ORF Transcript_16794/g.47798 Transcript_16794/m.47798 type:complete len:407 (+) Transcript_16794:31-1251(+)
MSSDDLPLPKTKYGVGVSWDCTGRTIDVDLQAVVVDTAGSIIDAVYYNNLKALKSITHSGDEQTGEKDGLDEVIWVMLSRLPQSVKLVIFVAACYSGGTLRDARNCMLHILEERKESEIAKFSMEQNDFPVSVFAMMLRDGSGRWVLRMINQPAQDGRHFIDILEPTLGNLIREAIPGAPKRQKVAFAMEKGAVVDLPATSALRHINAGLGWDVTNSLGKDVDLDVSAVFFSDRGSAIGAVFFGNTEEYGFQHSGDNLTGEGDGDDEVIRANLELIPAQVNQIFFVVNIYTNGVTFGQVSNAYCRIFDAEGSELACYILREGRGERGLIIARLFRESCGTRWAFQALGQFCQGKTWKDSQLELTKLFRKTARELQFTATPSFSGFSSHSLSPGPSPTKKSGVCAVM